MAVLVLLLLSVIGIWRIDSPRVERFRMAVLDRVVPNMEWAMAPLTGLIELGRDFQSYQRLSAQNQDLRREIQDMRAWREAALQLEQENARLRDLANLQLDPQITHVAGVVLADSGSPFRQSVLLNLGRSDGGVQDGWAVMDGIGLVGRISGVGADVSRVVLLIDSSSSVPVLVQPEGLRGLVVGDNRALPLLDFVENTDLVRPGDRVVTSGEGGVFPAGILIGQVVVDRDDRLRVRLAADLERLSYLRVLRSVPRAPLTNPGGLIAPDRALPVGPRARPDALGDVTAPVGAGTDG